MLAIAAFGLGFGLATSPYLNLGLTLREYAFSGVLTGLSLSVLLIVALVK